MGLPDLLVFQGHPQSRLFMYDLTISCLCISSPNSQRMLKHTSGLYAEPASGMPRGPPLHQSTEVETWWLTFHTSSWGCGSVILWLLIQRREPSRFVLKSHFENKTRYKIRICTTQTVQIPSVWLRTSPQSSKSHWLTGSSFQADVGMLLDMWRWIISLFSGTEQRWIVVTAAPLLSHMPRLSPCQAISRGNIFSVCGWSRLHKYFHWIVTKKTFALWIFVLLLC